MFVDVVAVAVVVVVVVVAVVVVVVVAVVAVVAVVVVVIVCVSILELNVESNPGLYCFSSTALRDLSRNLVSSSLSQMLK